MSEQEPIITVFFPVLNEEELLEPSVNIVHTYLTEKDVSHELIIVSNGSTDRTEEIGRHLERSLDYVRFLTIPEKGPGRAFKLAVPLARGKYFMCLDIDLSSSVDFIGYAIDLLAYSDMVVGSKTMGSQRRTLQRIIGSQCYILCAQVFFDLSISDYSIGCKAFRRSAVIEVIDNLDDWTGYIFELCLFLKYHQKRILQVGVDCNDIRISRFNLLYEAIYRFWHLYRYRRILMESKNWITAKEN